MSLSPTHFDVDPDYLETVDPKIACYIYLLSVHSATETSNQFYYYEKFYMEDL